jgi:hypothetical protein
MAVSTAISGTDARAHNIDDLRNGRLCDMEPRIPSIYDSLMGLQQQGL